MHNNSYLKTYYSFEFETSPQPLKVHLGEIQMTLSEVDKNLIGHYTLRSIDAQLTCHKMWLVSRQRACAVDRQGSLPTSSCIFYQLVLCPVMKYHNLQASRNSPLFEPTSLSVHLPVCPSVCHWIIIHISESIIAMNLKHCH